jgi:hypothetical protein
MTYIPLEATDQDSHTNEKGNTVILGTLRQGLSISPLVKYPIY